MLTISNLSKRFGDVVAVDDVSLSVARGRVVGFVGPNGAGKSTTMRSIFGLVKPDAGEIAWDGAPVDARTAARFGYMPEQRGLYPKMKILEQVAFFAELKGVDRATARRQGEEVLTALGLADRLDDPLEKLSHGNQQRVQLSVSLIAEPELLVLDEPFNGLDPVAVTVLEDVLAERVAAGVGVLFSSHQLDLVERVSDEIVIIVGGRVKAAGQIADVRRRAGSPVVTVEVQSPTVPLSDVITGDVVTATTRTATVRVDGDAAIDQLLAQSRSAGTVVRFDFDLPTLQDAFTALADGQIDKETL